MGKVNYAFSIFYQTKTSTMKPFILFIISILHAGTETYAQTDTIFAKGNQQILCSHIKETAEQYSFNYLTADNKKAKSSILKWLVDSVKYFVPVMDSNATVKTKKRAKLSKEKKGEKEEVKADNPPAEKAWKFTTAFGINLGNILEFNNTSGPDKKSLSLNTTIDLGANYKKEGKRFEMTNELHYQFGLEKEDYTSGGHIQRLQDELTSLHDLSKGMDKKNKWNFNLILKTATSLITVYDGNYFKNYTNLGPIQGFASPYDVNIAPGIKYESGKYLRISLSPYSFRLYGVQNKEIAAKGKFITELDLSGKYKNFQFTRLGAELNLWYDRKFKQWLELQYRLSFSSDYFANFGKNGLMDGLFITKIRIIKDIYLTHRATIKSNLAVNFWKPFYSQLVLLSYTKSF